ncbi:hypothetical protein JL193_08975 [Polaribacter batillariae]|uniref:DUF2974 domain-containing protein n=1 Tax=Polaribacter batillariae TaxID=2808900 RepID=A0ABX7SR15_9FLAO|nr:hypothetical protein [Polaribacter batillariae]QTD36297.1 hypothetical protein JL193_08975 [Polaribacter batillariae]
MKNRKINFNKLGILLLGFSIFLFNCEKEELIITEEVLETVSVNEALNLFKQNKSLSKKSNTTTFLTPHLEKIVQEKMENTNKLLTIIPATTIYSEHYSRILLLKINGEIKSVVFSMYSNKNSTTQYFSGEIVITDLIGNFLNGYRAKNGKLITQFKKKVNINKALVFPIFNSFQSSGYCPDHGNCTDNSLCNICLQQLDEVVVTSNISTNTGIPITTIYINGSPDFSDEQETISWIANDDISGSPNPTVNCTGGKIYNKTTQECECPEGLVEGANGNCVNTPTPCETALLSRDVYNTTNGQQELGQEPIPIKLSGGWELNNTLDTSSLNLTDPSSGFNSAVYQKLVNGVYQYMYVTEGTDPISIIDWYNNISQISGNSKQYEISVQNATKLNNLVGNRQLYFTGHSLGGGLASANSLATGRTAYTYNAAGLSYETRLTYNRGHNSEIHATVVKGEIVDKIQSQFGIKAEDSNTINYIEEESTYWQDFLINVHQL